MKASQWRKLNPEKAAKGRRRAHLRRYGLTPEQYDALHKAQEGVCALCRLPEPVVSKRLAVDHNHATGKVRALLCSNCNTGLGNLKDNPELLERAAAYVRFHR